MVLYGTNRAPDGLHRIVESAQPRIKIDPAVAYHVDCFGLDSSLFHVSYHFVAVHVASTAIRMGNDHHFFYSQLDDSPSRLRMTLPKGWEMTAPAFFIIFTSPL